jgi:hypothetical protein
MHENQGRPEDMTPSRTYTNYAVDADAVAEALIKRVNKLADERVQYRRALIHSVEVLETNDLDGPAIQA